MLKSVGTWQGQWRKEYSGFKGAMKAEGPREEEEAPAAEGAVLTARNGVDTGCEKAGLWESYRLSLRFANSHQYINYTV